MKISADPNSNDWVLKWGSVSVTLNGETILPKDCCFARSGADGAVHIYEKTKAGQIITVGGKPRVTEHLGTVSLVVGNNAGCKPCVRNAHIRRQWWKLAHLEK